MPENMVFIDGCHGKNVPISFSIYLIKTDCRNILVDAGCDTMPGFQMKEFYSPAAALQTVGLAADEITDVIITHGHHDHIEAISHFKNAVVHITGEEYISGKKYIPDHMPINMVKEEYMIGPKIKIIKWGGHSIGSAIIEISMDGITHILAGDECYTNDCVVRKIPTGAYYNLDKSREFIEKYCDEKYCVHTCHDISLKTGRII